VVRGTGVISPKAAKPQSREGQGSNGAVSRSRWRYENGDRRSPFRCQVARVPAPEARQKIGPGVSPGSVGHVQVRTVAGTVFCRLESNACARARRTKGGG
jgi:hypothetical protein